MCLFQQPKKAKKKKKKKIDDFSGGLSACKDESGVQVGFQTGNPLDCVVFDLLTPKEMELEFKIDTVIGLNLI